MKMLHGHGLGKNGSLSKTPDGMVSGNGSLAFGLMTPEKWQMSPPRKTKVSAVVRARPHKWPTQCPGVSSHTVSSSIFPQEDRLLT